MFEQKELNLKINTKELEAKIIEVIVKDIETYIYETLIHGYQYEKSEFKDGVKSLFRKAIRDCIEKYSADFRREVKQEVIERAVKNITELDKKELLKGLLK